MVEIIGLFIQIGGMIVRGIVKLIRKCCCKKKDKEERRVGDENKRGDLKESKKELKEKK